MSCIIVFFLNGLFIELLGPFVLLVSVSTSSSSSSFGSVPPPRIRRISSWGCSVALTWLYGLLMVASLFG